MTATELILLLHHELHRPEQAELTPAMFALLGKLLTEAERNGSGAAPAAPVEGESTAAPSPRTAAKGG